MSALKRIFLSHSGHNATPAIALARELKQKLTAGGFKVEIFNTSEPEHRYKDIFEVLAAGDDWAQESKRYEEELLAYLTKKLDESDAFLTLVTLESLHFASKYIQFEMETANRRAQGSDRTIHFIPCVSGVSLRELPRVATVFLGVDLDSPEGMDRLLERLAYIFGQSDMAVGQAESSVESLI